MSKCFITRFLALILFSAATGAFMTQDLWKKHLMGRAAYLQYEASSFDKHLGPMAHPFGHFVIFTIFIMIFMGIYEGIALAFSKTFGAKAKPTSVSLG